MRKRIKRDLPPAYERKLVREKVQGWLFDFNASDPVLLKEGGIEVPLDLTRAQLERLTDWLTDRIINGKNS